LQVISLIFPGDACNAFGHLIGGADHSIVTLTPAAFAEIDRGRFEELMALDPALTEAMLCDTLLQLAIAQEWIVNIGRRVALERVAHLLCEIFERLHAVDLLEGDSCPFPITQMDLADATGLSIVHLNRTLQELRGSGLIVLRERHLTIVDREALENLSLFHPDYLRVVPGKLP
ncbi:Crp/Fnr family transcriptional regulator, partial [Rhodopseudomonas sp. B29]|uniref:Crp/Fnr family transcriptional regulator n=1 Tax=Rhodopseudomonas sp. B29 TaxID=95607 RepID=UPI0003B530A5